MRPSVRRCQRALARPGVRRRLLLPVQSSGTPSSVRSSTPGGRCTPIRRGARPASRSATPTLASSLSREAMRQQALPHPSTTQSASNVAAPLISRFFAVRPRKRAGANLRACKTSFTLPLGGIRGCVRRAGHGVRLCRYSAVSRGGWSGRVQLDCPVGRAVVMRPVGAQHPLELATDRQPACACRKFGFACKPCHFSRMLTIFALHSRHGALRPDRATVGRTFATKSSAVWMDSVAYSASDRRRQLRTAQKDGPRLTLRRESAATVWPTTSPGLGRARYPRRPGCGCRSTGVSRY